MEAAKTISKGILNWQTACACSGQSGIDSKLISEALSVFDILDPLHPNIGRHILHNVLYTFTCSQGELV